MKSFLKKIYLIVPFKKSVYVFLKKFITLPKSVYKHLYFKGIFRVKYENIDFRIKHHGYQLENEIFWGGLENGWEKESIKLWAKLCRKSNVVIDIGANTGIYSLLAKSVNPKTTVYAFEPIERIFKKLIYNNSINNFDIKCEQCALSNYNGKGIIYDSSAEHMYSVTVNKNMTPNNKKVKEVEIDVCTLSFYFNRHAIKNVDLIKIDVETHEPEVLEGFINKLYKYKPALLIEVLDDEKGKEIETLVEEIPYLYFNINEKTGVRQVEMITQSDSFNYLLCTKEDASYLNLL